MTLSMLSMFGNYKKTDHKRGDACGLSVTYV